VSHPTNRIIAPHHCRRKQEILEELYPNPQPLDSHEDWERYVHLDLADLSLAERLVELDRARIRLTYDDSPSDWLLGRVRVLQEVVRHAG
jgi:hypothetical protein